MLLGVLAREAEPDELVGRQSARPFGSYRALAVECIVHVDYLAEVVCRHADAASEVSHDNVHVLVHLSAGLGIATCGSLSVKGVEDRFALHERQSGVAGACHHFVYHHGVGHECRTTALVSNVVGYKTTEIAHVLMFGMMQVVLH